jgi:cobalamin transport system ATP-binding protein
VIEARDLWVRFGPVAAVRGLSFRAESAGWTALIGPNGAGKTSALRALAGLAAYEGEVLLDGRDARRLGRRAVARLVAFVPQKPETPPALTVAEYVLLGRTPHIPYLGGEGRGDREAAARALRRLELEIFAERPLGSLSGGELQRAVLARALAQEAPVLLLDEPTTALDLGRQQLVLELVDALRGDGLTVVTTMHDLTLAGQYADRVLLVDHGRLVADGPPEMVFTERRLEHHYGASVRVLKHPGGIAVVPERRARPRT